MHAVDHFQAGQAGVANLGVFQRLGNDADHLATRSHGRIGNDTHQAHGATAVDQGQAARGDGLAEGDGRLAVGWVDAGAGATEHTNGTYGHCFSPVTSAHRVRRWPLASKPAAFILAGQTRTTRPQHRRRRRPGGR
ncbi:hypothetical protein D3C85_1329860 [compost metagenome]